MRNQPDVNNKEFGSKFLKYEKGKVSVLVMCYNHSDYIAQCIDSIIGQRGVDLKSIIIVDDNSNDGSRFILQEYWVKYPKLIKLVLHTENLHSKGEITPLWGLQKIDSEYLAFCDGDDYWIDNLKLMKQVSLFIADESLSLSHTGYRREYNNQNKVFFEEMTSSEKSKAQELLKASDFIRGNPTKHSTVMIRSETLDINFIAKSYGVIARDWLIAVSALRQGGAYYLSEITTIHRVHKNGVWNSSSRNEMERRKRAVKLFCAKELEFGKLKLNFIARVVVDEFRLHITKYSFYSKLKEIRVCWQSRWKAR
jgi:glycosyltransferase involved in cell wall biosynthesis